VLLTCSSSYNAQELVGDDFSDIDLSFCEEPEMNGKFSAMLFFFKRNRDVDTCLFANADTLFLDEEALLSSFNEANLAGDVPTVFLANPDKTRSDYREVFLNINAKTIAFQNTGVFVANRNWTLSNHQKADSGGERSLDDILFSEGSSNFVLVDSDILDVGTPERLKIARGVINDNH
jgi:hypothetical protein